LLRGIYRAHELGPATAWFGVLGNPALQSLGPWLHNRAFRRLGFDGVYLPFETSRPEAVVAMLQRGGLRGLSVTAPYKAVAAAMCHRLADDAATTGVVNTVVAEPHGHLVGHNTDVEGVLVALASADVRRGDSRPAAVLGTGGAARAGAVALLRLGFQVTMLGRSLEAVRDFAKGTGVQLASLSTAVLDELRPVVVVQATPVGSLGRDIDERLLPDWRPQAGTVVFDMVYQPHWTRFLRDAAAAGAIAVPGAAMFLGQARAQVRWFTGATVEPELLRQCLAGTVAAMR
jgi:shikimate dehydrogenase